MGNKESKEKMQPLEKKRINIETISAEQNEEKFWEICQLKC